MEWEEIDEEGTVRQLTEVPKGTYLLFNYTDMEKLVDVKIVDEKYVEEESDPYMQAFRVKDTSSPSNEGTELRIHYEYDRDTTTVDGINATELFEGVEYD